MSVEVPQVLQLQGGTPQSTAGATFAENLKITRNLQGGALSGGVMSLLTSSGLAGIMQNPMSAVSSLAQTAIGQMISQVTAALGTTALPVPATSTALGALSTVIGQLPVIVANFASEAPAAGFYGFLDLQAHANTVAMAGDPAPVALSLATAAAPISSGPLVTSVQAQAQTIANSVIALATTDAAGATQVAALTAQVQAVITNSSAAIGGLRAMIPALASAQAVGGAIAAALTTTIAPSANVTLFNTILQELVQPDIYAEMKATALAEFYVEPPTITTLAPLINTYNVAYSFMSKPTADTGPIEVI